MSLVGPRPIVDDEVGRYGAHISAYLRARPGLTGAWQISGRNDVSYEERVRLDADYVQNWSFGRDLAIIVRTIPAVLRAQGSY
jgi:exopolysaccharide production protein ExoY